MNDADRIASLVVDGFDRHYRRFRGLSAQARDCFERGDWTAMRAIGRERIGSYDARVEEAVARIKADVPAAANEATWPQVKLATTMRLLEHQQPELAETFYNSVVCRVLGRSYYTNRYLFWRQAVSTELIDALRPAYRVYYPGQLGLGQTLRAIVGDLQLLSPWQDLERDLRDVLGELQALLPTSEELTGSMQVHVLSSLFFRGRVAYLIGRLRSGPDEHAFAVPILKHQDGTLTLDAFLAGHDELVQLFTLSRSYFLVDMEVPSAFVSFLHDMFPARTTAELYTALGLQKQGKTLFFRELDFHLKHSSDRFVIAPGVKGMVMCVFTLPSFPWVFKLIRDEFAPPKDSDREQVMRQYTRVKLHDRVGRMADTWEYRDVALPLTRFSPEVLAELDLKAPSLLERRGQQLVIKHLYIERRLTPLDLYLARADPARRRAVLLDYGRALKELAQANLFPGDLLLKNFGVTRYERVVFYDYDEICSVTDCNFRLLPTPRDDDDEVSGEPWFSVGPRDVFPQELPTFLFSDPVMRDEFLELHPELATPAWWLHTQQECEAGREPELLPWPASRRFSLRSGRAR
jgi:isocitrate dehydrogenase kinase/phosphatase